MKTHTLKIEERWLKSIMDSSKTCEVRLNDRDYQKGDRVEFMTLILPGEETPKEMTTKNGYLVHWQLYKITHVLHFPEGLKDGYVALSIKPTK